MGKKKVSNKSHQLVKVEPEDSIEEVLAMDPKMKEDIKIKEDSRDVSSLEEKDRNFKISKVSEDEELDDEVDLEGELIATLEELSIERKKNKILSKKLNDYED